MPLSVAAWLYNVRRAAKLLLPNNPFPLADQANSLSCQPLLFVSSGRAGTTLLRSMLVAGGEIAIPPETVVMNFMALQFQAIQDIGWHNLSRLVISNLETQYNLPMWELDFAPVYEQAWKLPEKERSLARIIDLVFLHYAQQHAPHAVMWGDQTPRNIQRYQWLLKVFPKAKYLHVVRDGRDVIASFVQMGSSLESKIEQWQYSVENAAAMKRMLPPDQFLEVRYEDLVSDTTQVLQQVSAFAGIQYSDTMLDYWKMPTTLEHKYKDYHRNLAKPVTNASVGRWKERLTADQQRIIQRELSDLLEANGYKA